MVETSSVLHKKIERKTERNFHGTAKKMKSEQEILYQSKF